jgi:DNA-binding MarR family transcriptional regulator
MSTDPSFSPRVIGQAEKTLNAILDRLLAGTGLTEPQWVILTLAVTSGGTGERDQFTRMVADALKISQTEARALIGDLVAAQRLQITGEPTAITVTGAGRQLHSRIGAATADIIQRLWADLPAEDLATAGRMLAIITDRANAELARAPEEALPGRPQSGLGNRRR